MSEFKCDGDPQGPLPHARCCQYSAGPWAGGYSNKEIARTIHLAEGTVKNYVSDILSKLDTRDRTRAVLKAITLRII